MDFRRTILSKENVWGWWIVGFSVLIYGRSLWNGFNGEDLFYILANPSPGSFQGLLRFWTFSGVYSGFPLTISCLWLEHQWFGLHPWGYHAMNLVWHTLNSLLLFGLLRRITPSLAGITALLFAIHPIQVETVACIAERKNLLCFFFFVLAFHAFLDFVASDKKRNHIRALCFFTLALLSKCIAVCFISVPFLYAWWKQGSIPRRDILRYLPFFLIGALSILIPMQNENLGGDPSHMLFWEKIILAGKNFFFYIKQIVLPWEFLLFYPKWDLQTASWGNWIFPVGVASLFLIFYLSRRRLGRGAFALLAFYGISLFPALGFFKLGLFLNTYSADHFSYLSVPAILLLFCAFVQTIYLKFKERWGEPPGLLRKAVAMSLIFYLSFTSLGLTLHYKNDIVLAARFVLQRPKSFVAYRHFGITCLASPEACKNDNAIMALERAVQIDSKDSAALARLGSAYERKGLYEKAKQAYLQASLVEPDPFVQAYHFRSIGRVCIDDNNPGEAIFFLEKDLALRHHPGYSQSRRRYFYFEKAMDLSQESSVDRLLGRAWFLSGNFQRSAEAFRKAIEGSPGEAENYEGLGVSLMHLGDIKNAMPALQEAHRLNPQDKNAENNLKQARALLDEAVTQ